MAHSDDSVAQSGQQKERITIAFLVLAWTFVSLRIWTRTYVISNFGWDDSIMILAAMIFTVYCAALFYIDANGGGTHITNVPQLQLLTKWVVVSEATYVVAMMMLKISLGIFFARIVIKPWQIGLIYVNVGINIFSSVTAFFYCLFRCGSNLDNYVEQQLYDRCTPRKLDTFMAYQQAAITTLTDLVFVALPVFILWNANMGRRSKISVGFILCLATFGVICSLLRFRYVEGLVEVDDFFWASVNISIWSTIECGASIIAGCLATLRPFVKRMVTNARSSTKLGSCVKQISRTFRSNERSNSSTIPHYNSASTEIETSSSRGEPMTPQPPKEETLLEFLALPNKEAIALHDREHHRRESTEHILRQPSLNSMEFSWPAKMKDTRQTIHASWTLQDDVASNARPSERSMSR